VDAQVMSTQFPTASMNSARAPPRRTDHTYRDFSKYAVDKLLPPNKKAQSNFPAKLHRILSTPEFSHVRHVGGVVIFRKECGSGVTGKVEMKGVPCVPPVGLLIKG